MSHSKSPGAGEGCSNAICKGLDVSDRRRKTKSNKSIGIHVGCCGACTGQPGAVLNKGKLHEPTCADAPPLPPPSIFSTTVPVKWWALTVTASNRSVPGSGTEDIDWFQLVHKQRTLRSLHRHTPIGPVAGRSGGEQIHKGSGLEHRTATSPTPP